MKMKLIVKQTLFYSLMRKLFLHPTDQCTFEIESKIILLVIKNFNYVFSENKSVFFRNLELRNCKETSTLSRPYVNTASAFTIKIIFIFIFSMTKQNLSIKLGSFLAENAQIFLIQEKTLVEICK